LEGAGFLSVTLWRQSQKTRNP